jgi:hypothetical protein
LVGSDFHDVQFWENISEPIQFPHTIIGIYDWLTTRMRERSGNENRLPIGMPGTFDGLSVITYRNGKAGHILFTLLDTFANSLKDQPVKVEVEYRWGYTRLGMGDRYTLRMLATELWALTRNDWQVYPGPARETRADGTVCHDTFDNADKFHQTFIDDFAAIPEKVLVGTPRGSAIRSQLDQGRLLQNFAWAGQAIETGVAFSVNNFQIEYWYDLTLQPQPDDDDLRVCPLALHELWFEKLSALSSQIAQQVRAMNVVDYRFEMRYVGNKLRVWFVPAHPSFNDWKPLIESSLIRDKWIIDKAFALSFPPCPLDDEDGLTATIIFDGVLQERYDDPEVQGGKIALVAAIVGSENLLRVGYSATRHR